MNSRLDGPYGTEKEVSNGKNTISTWLKKGPVEQVGLTKGLAKVVPVLTKRKAVRLNIIQTHPQRNMIEREIISLKSLGEIAQKWGLSEATIRAHRDKVLAPTMAAARLVDGDDRTRKAEQYLDYVFGKVKQVVDLAEMDKEGPNLDKMLDALELGRKVARDQGEIEGSIEPKGSKFTLDQRGQVAPGGQVVMMPKTWESPSKRVEIPTGPKPKQLIIDAPKEES